MTQSQKNLSRATISAEGIVVAHGDKKTLNVPSVEVLPNEVLVIIGPNGSGKTTLVLCLALLMKPDKGSIAFRGEVVTDSRQTLQIRRRTAVVFQEALLLNSSVWNNVTMGLKFRGVKKEEAKARAQRWLERFGVNHLAQRQAKTLSGGEAKRVSLARAFALEPEVLFLDEPFEGLDSPTRQSLTSDFESVLRETKTSTVMVTHDRNEALILADRVAVLINGTLRQIGRPNEIFNYPIDEEVASFVEAGNIMHGSIIAQTEGLALVDIDGQQLEVVSGLPTGTKVTMFLHDDDITLSLQSRQNNPSSARNQLTGKVIKAIPLGSQIRVTVDCGIPLVSVITRRSWEEMGLSLGQTVTMSFKASALHLIPHH